MNLESVGGLAVHEILTKVGPTGAASAASVSKRFRDWTADESIWSKFCADDLQLSVPEDPFGNPISTFKRRITICILWYGFNWNCLQVHHVSPLNFPFANVRRCWARLKCWLSENFPEALATLRKGASEDEIKEFEKKLKVKLPLPTRVLYRFCDGQDILSKKISGGMFGNPLGLIGGYCFYESLVNVYLLPLSRIILETKDIVHQLGFSRRSKYIVVATSSTNTEKIFFLNCTNGQLCVGTQNLATDGEMIPCVPNALLSSVHDSGGSQQQDALLLWLEEHGHRLHNGIIKLREEGKIRRINQFPEEAPHCSTAITNGVQYPLLLPGEKEFVYESCSHLSSSSGSIEGSFTFVSGKKWQHTTLCLWGGHLAFTQAGQTTAIKLTDLLGLYSKGITLSMSEAFAVPSCLQPCLTSASFIPASFVLADVMGMWRHRVNTPTKLEYFRQEFSVPADVHLKLAGDDDSIIPTENTMPLPIIAFTECGLRLPLNILFREILHYYKLNPMQLAINSYRVIFGIIALAKQENVRITLADIQYCYTMCPLSLKEKGYVYYLKLRFTEFKITKMSIYSLFLERLKRARVRAQYVRKPAKDFRQSYVPSKDLKKLLDLPVHKRKAPLLLNFIPTYKSTLPDVPKKKKKSISPPSATTLPTVSTSRADQGSTSDPADLSSTSTSYLIPIPERKRRRRLVKTAEMGRPKPITIDLLADLPADVDAVPTQSMPLPKPKRIKKAQPKAKATEAEAEDALPISQLAESKKSASASAKRSAEAQSSESTQSKKPRSSSATTSGSKIPRVLWVPEITLEDKPVLASESAEDINVGMALSTAVLFPGDLERNAKMSEYENYAFMLQRSVQAIQHAHSLFMQAFETREKLADMRREVSALKKENKTVLTKMKKLEDQAEAATKAQQMVEEKAKSAEAIRKVAEAKKKEAEVKKAQAKKELQKGLATKKAEIKEADEKAYAQGMADVTEEYKLQVKQACNRGFSLGWMALAKKLNILDDSLLRKADAIPLSFPPPPSSSQPEGKSESESEGEKEGEDEALVRKSKEAGEIKSPPQDDQVLDLTHKEDEEVIKETTPEQASSDVPPVGKSVDETLAEIDAEIAANKEAEVSLQETSQVQIQPVADAEKS
ncbi:hypothetical protein TEA_012267 [Camellia sinensis var. sinensis]|uniref:Uncharacterized protein n=1 Tax=Camellia sinensis var. sinensis TaxID=542762 RepID=A0A4S4DJZ4_CAMSN|nr:hypothetical protein TEA_012267 [Camellia sinensis var. sinensis]